jgi:hypothetical protein
MASQPTQKVVGWPIFSSASYLSSLDMPYNSMQHCYKWKSPTNGFPACVDDMMCLEAGQEQPKITAGTSIDGASRLYISRLTESPGPLKIGRRAEAEHHS